MTEHTFDTDPPSGSLPPPSDTGDRTTMAGVEEASRAVEEARMVRLYAICDLDRSRAFAYDGFTSTTAFLVARCGMSTRGANREVFVARSLQHMPYASKLAASGVITVSQLEVLAHAHSRHPEPFARDEATIAESVNGLRLSDTRRLVDYWIQSHDEADPDAGSDEPDRVFLSTSWQGRGRLDGDLSADHHEILSTALDALIGQSVRAMPREELPKLSQLRAEALVELARRYLDAPDTPTDHGNRPHLTVIVDHDTLIGRRPHGTSELANGTVISPATARRLACDAQVCRLLTGPAGEILDMGRSRRTVTPAQWRALRTRDRHCRFPHCRRPWNWCDAHHRQPWIQGGPTDLNEIILLCRHHHRLTHEGGWTITGTLTNLTFIRPDHTPLPGEP